MARRNSDLRRWRTVLLVSFFVLAALCPSLTWAEEAASLRLPAVFGDHMVVQREVAVPIWGWAPPETEVRVGIAEKVKTAKADAEGRWRIDLDPQPAGGPVTITVDGGGKTIILSDVLVGEVWICSGQSNMWWPLERTADAAAQIAKADHPKLRLFTVAQSRSPRDLRTDCEGQWAVCTPKTARRFSAVAYYFGRGLHTELDVPVGLINSSWGGTPVESWTSRPALAATKAGAATVAKWERWATEFDPDRAAAKNKRKLADWEAAKATAEAEGREPPRKPRLDIDPLKNQWFPSSLYNAMIAPVVPYGIRGAIWYQGESNAGNPDAYREVFPAMITDWRKAWNQPKMPFYFVQLANFITPARWGRTNWAYIREAQTAALELPNTGMAVTIDIGDPKNIHPGNKLDVGRRLSLWALAKIHGRDVAHCGPLYRSMKRKGGAIRLQFDHADELAAKDGALRTFQIAGADKAFHPAKAVIDGKTVVVSSDQVAAPVAVRYAWDSNPDQPNLYNAAGLPAIPLRTDTWKLEQE